MRGLSVPTTSWYYNNTDAQMTAANLNTELTVDYTPNNGVTVSSGPIDMTVGALSLGQGKAAVVYIDEAGNIDTIDAGNTYALQIQAGQATAVQQVQVVSQE
jgi:hypothetical protein